MSDITLSDVEVIINKALESKFEKWTPKIIEECTRNNELFQARCKANQIFQDKENVKNFYTTRDDLNQHIDMHKTNEIKVEKRQGFIIKILTSSVIAQVVYNLFQWKHK